jgi:alkanesulfonate monooxygenase SsuD/methylene tetrahydromethanopterin reductase-like flavin-dependent oxidoreductase (luciferase family)
MGYQGPQGARRAGLLGEGLLTASAKLWPAYRDALQEGGHPMSAGRMGGGINGWVTDDPERDWPLVAKHVAAQIDSYRMHMVEGTGQPVPKPIDPDELRSRESRGRPLDSIVYGTPQEVAANIMAHTAGAPVTDVFLWASVAGMPESTVAEGIHTICSRLAPLLADYDPTTADPG